MFLAKLIGLFMLIEGIMFFLRAHDFKGVAKQFSQSPLLQIISGTFALIVGLLIVLTHNNWDTYWQSLISTFGWISLMKGILLLWSPELIDDVVETFERPAVMHVASLTMYTLAIILLAYGFGFIV